MSTANATPGPQRLDRYRAVLALPSAKPLLLAGLIGRMPIGMVPLPLVLSLRQSAGSYATAGLMVAAYMGAVALIAPVWGRLLDRWRADLVLGGTAVAFFLASLLLAIALDADAGLWLIAGAVALFGLTRPSVTGAMQSLWAQLTPDRTVRQTAYALHSQELGITWIAGPLIVSGLLALFGERVGALVSLGVAGFLGGAGAMMIAVLWRRRATEPAARTRGSGRRHSLYTTPYLLVVCAVALLEIALGALMLAVTAFAQRAGAASASGVLVALWFLGCVFGGVWFGAHRSSMPLARQFRWALLGVAFACAVFATIGSVWLMALALLLGGLTLAAAFTIEYLLVADLTPAAARAEGFNWLQTVAAGGGALGAALSGRAVEHFQGAGAGFIVAAACAAAAAFLVAVTGLGRRRAQPQQPLHTPTTEGR